MFSDYPDRNVPADDTLGGRISLARDARKLSVYSAAGILCVPPETWSAWENDRAEPPADRLKVMARTLDVSLWWLLSGRGAGPAWATDDAA